MLKTYQVKETIEENIFYLDSTHPHISSFVIAKLLIGLCILQL